MAFTAILLASIFCQNLRSKKCEKRGQKWARNPGPFLEPSSIGTITEGSENGPILGLRARCGRLQRTVWVLLHEMIGTPFAYHKFRGGTVVTFIGYELDYGSRLLGMSEAWGRGQEFALGGKCSKVQRGPRSPRVCVPRRLLD